MNLGVASALYRWLEYFLSDTFTFPMVISGECMPLMKLERRVHEDVVLCILIVYALHIYYFLVSATCF